MFVINKLTKFSLPSIKLLTIFLGNIYYHKCEINHFELKKSGKIIPLQYNRLSKSNYKLPDYNLGENDYINKFVSNYLPSSFEKLFLNEFKNIKNFKDKIDISFISSLSFEEVKTIYTLYKVNNKHNKLKLIHTNFHTFACQTNGVENNKDIFHYYLPIDDFIELIILIIKKIKLLFKYFLNLFWHKAPNNKIKKDFSNRVGIIVHQSLSYGNLYKKLHFFSERKESPLHLSNVILFNRNVNAKIKENESEKYSHLKISINLKSLLKIIILFTSKIIFVRSIRELYGLIFVLSIYLRYKSWINTFKEYQIKNLIYDYDILVSKPLSLALEYLKIKSFAFQERPNTVFGRIDGVIVNTYFTAGKLYSSFLKNNKSFHFENNIDLGIWRQVFFHKNNLINMEEIHHIPKRNRNVDDFKTKILFLGYYFNPENNMPCTNKVAIDDFLELLIETANKNKKCAIILRMKILSKYDTSYILNKISSRNNIFICDHYDNQAVSYRLCKESDLIISTITSLALESLVYGKKVIFINNIFPFSNMAKDLFPKEFFFAIPNSKKSIHNLSIKCLSDDQSINNKYENLKKELSGEIDLSDSNVIADTIESLLI